MYNCSNQIKKKKIKAAITQTNSYYNIMVTWNMQNMCDVKTTTEALSYSNCIWFSFSYFSISINY